MVTSPKQQNLSEHKKALRIRHERIQQREWVINQKRRSYSTNRKPNSQQPTQSSPFYISRTGGGFRQFKIKRKPVPLPNQVNNIPELVHYLDLEWNPFQTVLDASCRLRQLLAHESHPPIDQVIDAGAVPYFVQYLNPTQIEPYCQIRKTSDEPTDPSKMNVISLQQLYALQFEATWCITNIVSGTREHTATIVETGCVPLLIKLIESEDVELRRQSAWAVGNIAGDSPDMRDYVNELGAMKSFLKLVEMDQSVSTRRNAVWAISNLLRGRPTPEKCKLAASAIPLLCQLILNQELDAEILTDACWALEYATDGPPEVFEYFAKQKTIVMKLVELLDHPTVAVQTPIVRTLGNVLTGDEEQTEVIISCGILPCFTKLFEHPKSGMRKEVMWALSNITAGRLQIQAVIDAEIFPKLFIMLSPARNEVVEVKKEMYFVIANALTGAYDHQMKYLIDQGVIQQLCGGLLEIDPTVLTVLLDGLESILKYGEQTNTLEEICNMIENCGGTGRLEALQHHNNEAIYQKVVHLLENYWNCSEVSQQQTVFEFGPVSKNTTWSW